MGHMRRFAAARLWLAAALLALTAAAVSAPLAAASLPPADVSDGAGSDASAARAQLDAWVRVEGVEDGGSYAGGVDVRMRLTEAGHRRLQIASQVRVVLNGNRGLQHSRPVRVDTPGEHRVTVYVLAKPPPHPSRRGVQLRHATLLLPGAAVASAGELSAPRHRLLQRTIRFTVTPQRALPAAKAGAAPWYGARLAWGIPQAATRKRPRAMFGDVPVPGLPLGASGALTDDQHLAVSAAVPSVYVPGMVIKVPIALRRDDGRGAVVPAGIQFSVRVTAVNGGGGEDQHRDLIVIGHAGAALATITTPDWATSGIRVSATAVALAGCRRCQLNPSPVAFSRPVALDGVRHVGNAPDGAMAVAGDVVKALIAPWASAAGRGPSVVDIHATLFVAHDAAVSVPPGTVLRFAPGTGVVVEGSLHLAGTRAAPVVLQSSARGEEWAGVAVAGQRARVRIEHAYVHGATSSGALITVSDRALAAVDHALFSCSIGAEHTTIGVSVESGASLDASDLTVHHCAAGVQLVNAAATVDHLTVTRATTASIAAIGASRLDITNSTLGTPSPDHDSDVDEPASCLAAVCTSRGSPRLSVKSSLLQRCPGSGIAVFAAQTPQQPASCAAQVRVHASVVRECQQAIQIAHGGRETTVSVVDSLLIRNDVAVRTGCGNGASPQGRVHLDGTTMLLNGQDYLQAHHSWAGVGDSVQVDGSYPTPGLSLRLSSAVASSMTHRSASWVDAAELASTVVCSGANPWVAAWTTLATQGDRAHTQYGPEPRAPASVPGVPSQCVPVTGSPFSTLAVFWSSLAPAAKGLIEATITDTPGVEVTGRWRVVNGSAAFDAAIDVGLMPELDPPQWNLLSTVGEPDNGGPIVRQWWHRVAWTSLQDLPEEGLHSRGAGSGAAAPPDAPDVHSVLGVYEPDPVMCSVDGDPSLFSARLAAAATTALVHAYSLDGEPGAPPGIKFSLGLSCDYTRTLLPWITDCNQRLVPLAAQDPRPEVAARARLQTEETVYLLPAPLSTGAVPGWYGNLMAVMLGNLEYPWEPAMAVRLRKLKALPSLGAPKGAADHHHLAFGKLLTLYFEECRRVSIATVVHAVPFGILGAMIPDLSTWTWTAPPLGALYPTGTMMNQNCYSLGAVACAAVDLIQLRAASDVPLPLSEPPAYAFLDEVLNSTQKFADDTTLVLSGTGLGHNDTFIALDGNHRLLILLTRAMLWDSPVCNTEAARAVSQQRYGVVCHNVSMATTRVKTLMIMSPRIKNPDWRKMFNLDPALYCPPHRAISITCLTMRPGFMVHDPDPVFGPEAVQEKLDRIMRKMGKTFDELKAESREQLEDATARQHDGSQLHVEAS